MPARTAVPVNTEGRETFRLAPPVVLWWAWVVFVLVNVVDFAVQGLPSARFGAVVAAILFCCTGLAYTLALRPRVYADGAGVTVVNPFRVHHIPWRLIQTVDAGEWVRVNYAAPAADAADTATQSSAGGKRLSCWALYVSAAARRKIARGPRPRRGLLPGSRATARWLEDAQRGGGHGSRAQDTARLPDEARRLAAMPAAQAIAVRLDSRAARERTRQPRPSGTTGPGETATARWSWLSIAAAAVPAIILVIVAILG
ncbi:MAG TPA: PH domain-containing protein [Trebonia sp.]|nr:PH domain-containing protein [Trebonia sp.]